MRDVLNTTLCNKVCQWLATGWWFSQGTLVSSTNKTDCHDIAEILLQVALNNITLITQVLKVSASIFTSITTFCYTSDNICLNLQSFIAAVSLYILGVINLIWFFPSIFTYSPDLSFTSQRERWTKNWNSLYILILKKNYFQTLWNKRPILVRIAPFCQFSEQTVTRFWSVSFLWIGCSRRFTRIC